MEEKKFLCGVIEGFYGRPWTTEQRKDLFRKLQKWGLTAYVYAPKDDYKHRAFWRELYTVEEADHLSSLIAAAKEHGIRFYYALSPGLDMTYSSQKEIQALKRKLDQVSQFGCEAFALLFDDIEPELSKADKEVFQTFANAQVSVTNDVYTHLKSPYFLFCPTQYCSSRAVPTVLDSEYLNTLGSKLNLDIDIMWTGKKVISKLITIESIQEVTEVLRRPPVIWDNLHANDYDQKRVFLGPYTGRSPELIPHLRGVMTNPNCEFHGNRIAIHTLAHWSRCNFDAKVNRSISADMKLETENEDGINSEDMPVDCCSSKNVYHPKVALKNAIEEWLPEFFVKKEAWGPITKPQPQVTMVTPIIPIIPSINTCMSLTTTTTTSTTAKTLSALPEVNTTQLQALADVCVTVNSSAVNPIPNAVMNSLTNPTKVVTNEDILNPIPTTAASNVELPKKVPISVMPVPILQPIKIAPTTDSTCLDTIVTASEIVNTIQPTCLGAGDGLALDGNKPMNEAVNGKENHFLNEEMSSDAEKSAVPLTSEVEMKIADENTNETQEHMIDSTEIKIGSDSAVISEADSTDGRNNEKQLDEDISIAEDKMIGSDVVSTTVVQPAPSDISKSNGLGVNGDADSEVPMLEENNLSPCSTANEPMECGSLTSQISPRDEIKVTTASNEDVVMTDTAGSTNEEIFQNRMQVESAEASPLSNNNEMHEDGDECLQEKKDGLDDPNKMTVEDLHLLCDLFYLPFEHGSRGHKLMIEFNWLKTNAYVLSHSGASNKKANDAVSAPTKPEITEWLQRAERFSELCQSVLVLLTKLSRCANKEICHDLFSYVWDIAGALILLNAFIKWLSLGHFPANISTFTQGTYTWFSKGWKEAFMSGDQEPWVFRGGLIADFQRLMPVDSGNDLFFYKLPDMPTSEYYLLRPYTLLDEAGVYEICTRCHLKLLGSKDEDSREGGLPENLHDLIADSVVGPFLTLEPEFCMVAHEANDETAIVGYVAAALDVNVFSRNYELCWLPAMCEKYPKLDVNEEPIKTMTTDANETLPTSTSASAGLNESAKPTEASTTTPSPSLPSNLYEMQNAMRNEFYNYKYECPTAVSASYPAVLTTAILDKALTHDQAVAKRLVTVVLAALRSNGVFGVHVRLDLKHMEQFTQYYTKTGFVEVYRDERYIYMGRRF